jgi:hypothetical protein
MKTKLFLTGLAFVALTSVSLAQTTQPNKQAPNRGQGMAWVDENKNGVCDNFESRQGNRGPGAGNCFLGGRGNGRGMGNCYGRGPGRGRGMGKGMGQGNGRNFVDNNNNGVCDNAENKTAK